MRPNVIPASTGNETRRGVLKGTRFVGVYAAWSSTLAEFRAGQWETAQDAQEIRRVGFDGIRYYLASRWFQAESGAIVQDQGGWERLAAMIDWCRAARLALIVDLHEVYGHTFSTTPRQDDLWTNPTRQQAWLDLLTAVVQFVKERDPAAEVVTGIDLLNEPNPGDESGGKFTAEAADIWNDLAARAIRTVRALDTRPVIVEGPFNANPDAFGNLRYFEESNVVYSFHTYDPKPFTMQGNPEPWHCYQDAHLRYPGSYEDCKGSGWGGDWDKGRLEQWLGPVIQWQADHPNAVIWVGEWSAGWANTAPRDDTLALIRDWVELFDRYGFAYTWHHWGGKRYTSPDTQYLSWTENGRPMLDRDKLRALGLPVDR